MLVFFDFEEQEERRVVMMRINTSSSSLFLITLPLFLLLSPTSSSECFSGVCDMPCDKGPYILTDVHTSSHEGLGSSWQRNRLGLILEGATGYEWVRTFYSKFRNVGNRFDAKDAENSLELMGLCSNVTCNMCSLTKGLKTGKLKKEVIEFKSPRNDPKFKGLWDDDTLALCRAAGKYSNDTGAGVASSLLPPSFTTPSASASSSSSSHHHLSFRERREHHLYHNNNNNNNIVYEYPGNSILQNPACSLSLFSSYYSSHLAQEHAHPRGPRLHTPLPFPPPPPPPSLRRGRVVIHVRWGDVKPQKNVTSSLNNRIIPFHKMNAILGVIKDGVSKEGVDIYVIAEATGNEAYFLEMKAIIPNLQFIQGGPDTVMRDLEMMAQADVLVASRSSFAVMGASMNGGGILLVEHTSKYQDWEYFRDRPVLTWKGLDKESFRNAIQRHPLLSKL